MMLEILSYLNIIFRILVDFMQLAVTFGFGYLVGKIYSEQGSWKKFFMYVFPEKKNKKK